LFVQGERNISEDLFKIREALKNKNGLVPDQDKGQLHTYLDSMLAEEAIDASRMKMHAASKPPLSRKSSSISSTWDTEEARDYIVQLDKHEGLLVYYMTTMEGLNSLFTCAKLSNYDIFTVDSADPLATSLQMAGEIIPVVGSIVSALGTGLEAWNEHKIKEKLGKISSLVPEGHKVGLSKTIAQHLLLSRRNYLDKLSFDDVKSELSSIDRLKNLFISENQWKIKAKVDLKILEAILLTSSEADLYSIVTKDEFCEVYGHQVCEKYLGEEKGKRLAQPLTPGEVPNCFKFVPTSIVPASFFEGPNCLMKILRQFPSECDKTYEQRLTCELCLHDQEFAKLA
jgi:hypothetical protein